MFGINSLAQRVPRVSDTVQTLIGSVVYCGYLNLCVQVTTLFVAVILLNKQ